MPSAAASRKIDFRAYMPQHNYIYAPSREPWAGRQCRRRLASMPVFNAAGTPKLDKKGEPVTMPASAWLDQHRPVEQMTGPGPADADPRPA